MYTFFVCVDRPSLRWGFAIVAVWILFMLQTAMYAYTLTGRTS